MLFLPQTYFYFYKRLIKRRNNAPNLNHSHITSPTQKTEQRPQRLRNFKILTIFIFRVLFSF